MDKEIIIKLFEKKEYKAIKSIFDTMNPVDTATLLPEFDEKEMAQHYAAPFLNRYIFCLVIK